jgi:soluble lytic murein transglycosylase-like protein
MADGLPPPPSYPSYAGFLSNLIGGLPTDYRNAELQQGAVDVQNAFKGGVPTNPDGSPNYAAALQTLAKAGDPSAVSTLGPMSQTQGWQQQGQTMSPMLSGGAPGPSVPSAAPNLPPAPMSAPAPSAGPGFTASMSEGSPPTLAALVSGAIPDPAKSGVVAGLIGQALKVDPSAPLNPDQMARAQRIIAANNLGSGSTDPRAAAADIAGKERAAGYDPNGKLTQAQAVAIATGNAGAPAGGASGPFALPPTAEAVWNRMVSQESRGNQFNPDGSVVTSPKGAVGVAQVMPGTGPEAAKLAGLPWDPARFKNDPNYNAALGKAYYAQQLKTFGSIDVAAAAYNAGPNAVLSAQAKASKRGGDWLSYMPAETQDYVAKVTSGGAAPQPQAGAGAQPQGRQPIFPQPARPAGFNDDQSAIQGYDREIARLASIPGNAGLAQARVLQDERDRFIASREPREVRAGQSFVDATGKTVYTAPYPGTNASPEAIDAAADIYHETGKFPPGTGRGVQGAQTMNAITNRAYEKYPDEDPSEWPDRWQTFQAEGQGKSLLAKRGASLELAGNNAASLIPRVREASKLVSRTQYPSLNKIIEMGLEGTGDPNVVKLGVAVESLAQTYARVLAPSGSPTAADKANAHAILNQYWGQGQIDAAMDQMELEIASEKASLKKTRGEMRAGARGGDQDAPSPQLQSAPAANGQPAKVSTKDEYDALPKGTSYVAPDGSVRTKQ